MPVFSLDAFDIQKDSNHNAPIICNYYCTHHGEGLGIVGKMSLVFVFALSPLCRVSAGVLFWHWDNSKDFTNCMQSQIAEILPTFCSRSAGLLAGICWKKRQSPLSVPMGGRALVTNDHILHNHIQRNCIHLLMQVPPLKFRILKGAGTAGCQPA